MNKPEEHLARDKWLTVNRSIRVPHAEFTFTFSRSSGPGGQNVNKVNTKVQLRWPVEATSSLNVAVKQRFVTKYRRRITSEGELLVTSQRYRDQARNIADCLDKLRSMIEGVATPPAPRRKTKPTRSSRERRLKSKREQSEKKQARRRPKSEE